MKEGVHAIRFASDEIDAPGFPCCPALWPCRDGMAANADGEFQEIKEWIYRSVGISHFNQKKATVMGRLALCPRHHQTG
jgi:hypothetical protein